MASKIREWVEELREAHARGECPTAANEIGWLVGLATQFGAVPLDEAVLEGSTPEGSEIPPSVTDVDVGRGSLADARAARDEALRLVDAAADPEWKGRTLAAIKRLAERSEFLTADDVWEATGEMPSEPRAMGPVMLAARSNGWIEKTDRVQPSVRIVNHARDIAVWRSLIQQGEQGTLH